MDTGVDLVQSLVSLTTTYPEWERAFYALGSTTSKDYSSPSWITSSATSRQQLNVLRNDTDERTRACIRVESVCVRNVDFQR